MSTVNHDGNDTNDYPDARTTDRLAEIGPALEEAIRIAINDPSRYAERIVTAGGFTVPGTVDTHGTRAARAAMVAIQQVLAQRDLTITTGEIAWRGTQPPPEPPHPGQRIAHIADAGAAAMIRALAIELGPDGHINGGDLEDLAARIKADSAALAEVRRQDDQKLNVARSPDGQIWIKNSVGWCIFSPNGEFWESSYGAELTDAQVADWPKGCLPDKAPPAVLGDVEVTRHE